MRREEAEAARESRQRGDHEHTYLLRQQGSGEWEVVQIHIPRPTSHRVAVAASPETDAEQTAELADAARRLKALRERRTRLANVPSGEPAAPPEDLRSSVARQIPGFG